jgi:serine/threonine protein kinase
MIHKDLIARGLQGEVYTLHDAYAAYLRDNLHIDMNFVVKKVPYSTFSVNELTIHKYTSTHAFPHIIPLVHWMASGEHASVDAFDVNPNLNQPLDYLYMTFPRMEGSIEDLSRFTFRQRIDMVLQLIHMIQSLHSVGVCHNDFDLHNIMYVRSGTGVHLFLIDFGLAEMIVHPEMIHDDYVSLATNISYLIWDQNMDDHTCLKDRRLCNLLYEIENATTQMDFRELIRYTTQNDD